LSLLVLPSCNLETRGKGMAHKLLTERFVASVKPTPDVAQVDYFDLGHPALALRVGHREKVFTLHVRKQGKLKRRTLGRYPEMTLAEAREAWRMQRKAAAEGKVLVAVDAATSVAALLVSDVVAQWLEGWRRGKAANSIKAVERQMKSEILPAWGPRDIRSIGKHDVMSLLDGIANRGATTQARRVFATLQTFFRWCRKRDVLEANPMEALERKDFGSEESRDRVLSPSELGKLLAHIRGANHYDPFLAATHFLALSGNRPEEVGALRWDEIEGDVVAFPGARMKNKLPFDLPITPHLRAIIDSAPRIDGCPYVFTTDGKRPLRGWDKAKKKIDKATGLEGWQFRDLRRTMATGMQRLGISEDVIEACSARLKTGVKKVYQRHLYAAEKRKAFERWAVENS
jgi:integrase